MDLSELSCAVSNSDN